MKPRVSGIQLFYIVMALAALGSFGYAQSRGMRLINVFTGSLTSYSGHDGPDHK